MRALNSSHEGTYGGPGSPPLRSFTLFNSLIKRSLMAFHHFIQSSVVASTYYMISFHQNGHAQKLGVIYLRGNSFPSVFLCLGILITLIRDFPEALESLDSLNQFFLIRRASKLEEPRSGATSCRQFLVQLLEMDHVTIQYDLIGQTQRNKRKDRLQSYPCVALRCDALRRLHQPQPVHNNATQRSPLRSIVNQA